MSSWAEFESFLVAGYAPVFGSNPYLAGLFVSLILLIALGMWGVGLETIVILMSALVILFVGTTALLPPQIGFIVIFIMLIPLYWALRGFFSR